jgi:hypothetical protein
MRRPRASLGYFKQRVNRRYRPACVPVQLSVPKSWNACSLNDSLLPAAKTEKSSRISLQSARPRSSLQSFVSFRVKNGTNSISMIFMNLFGLETSGVLHHTRREPTDLIVADLGIEVFGQPFDQLRLCPCPRGTRLGLSLHRKSKPERDRSIVATQSMSFRIWTAGTEAPFRSQA